MKKTAVTLAAVLALLPVQADDPPPFTGFIEGFCAGVILGVATGAVIIIAYRCITKPKELTQYPSSRPDWTIPPEFPPISTNAPPGTNVVKMLINSGDALPMYDISSMNIQDRNGGCLFTNVFATTVQYSEDGLTWATLYRLHGWVSGKGRLVVASTEDWTALATNYIFGATNVLNLPVSGDSPGRFYRLVAP